MVAIFGILDRDDIADFFLSKIEDSVLSNVIEFLRALRLLRLVHLSTHMSTLRMISDVVKDSREQLFFLMFIFAFSSIGFGTLFYIFEHSPGCGPTSIPDAMWWSSSTITTLGYGDLFPVTNPGKVCAVVCSIMGVLAISLPLPAIVNSYQRVKNREKIEKMRSVLISFCWVSNLFFRGYWHYQQRARLKMQKRYFLCLTIEKLGILCDEIITDHVFPKLNYLSNKIATHLHCLFLYKLYSQSSSHMSNSS